MPARRDHLNGVLQTTIDTGMLKDHCRVNKLYRLQFKTLCRQVNAVEFKTRQMGITLPDGFEILRIQVRPDNSLSDAGVDAIEPVSAGDSKDRD